MPAFIQHHAHVNTMTGKIVKEKPVLSKEVDGKKVEVWSVAILFESDDEWNIEVNGKEIFHSKDWEEIKASYEAI